MLLKSTSMQNRWNNTKQTNKACKKCVTKNQRNDDKCTCSRISKLSLVLSHEMAKVNSWPQLFLHLPMASDHRPWYSHQRTQHSSHPLLVYFFSQQLLHIHMSDHNPYTKCCQHLHRNSVIHVQNLLNIVAVSAVTVRACRDTEQSVTSARTEISAARM